MIILCAQEECRGAAVMLVKPHAAAYEQPYCQQHGDKKLAELAENKEPYTLHFVDKQPTPEEELRATIGKLEFEKAAQHAELVELRAEITKLRAGA